VVANYSGDANYRSETGTSNSVQDTPLTVTSVKLVNGGTTAGKIESGDSIAITFSASMSVSSICSTWTNDGTNQSLNDGAVTVKDGGASDDSVTFGSATCNLNIGAIDLGSNGYIVPGSGDVTFSGSAIAWNVNALTLTITLGTNGGTGLVSTVSSSNPKYYASSSMTDSWGFGVSNIPFSLPTGMKQF
jgi:hypothetical protein